MSLKSSIFSVAGPATLLALNVAAALTVAAPLHAQPLVLGKPVASSEGLVRTLLERHVDEQGNEFDLILDVFPPGIIVPAHHHPTTGLNYILEGAAESQYEGEPLRHLASGDSFQDHADIRHAMFRNPDPDRPLKILISFEVKKGQAFFIAP